MCGHFRNHLTLREVGFQHNIDGSRERYAHMQQLFMSLPNFEAAALLHLTRSFFPAAGLDLKWPGAQQNAHASTEAAI